MVHFDSHDSGLTASELQPPESSTASVLDVAASVPAVVNSDEAMNKTTAHQVSEAIDDAIPDEDDANAVAVVSLSKEGFSQGSNSQAALTVPPTSPPTHKQLSTETTFISCFAFKQCSAPVAAYRGDHPKGLAVMQALEAVIVELSSSIGFFTEIDGGPLRHMQETLASEYGYGHRAVEMRLEAQETPSVVAAPNTMKRTTSCAVTHSSRGHNLIGWNKSVFRLVAPADCPLLHWTFPGVVLEHRRTGKVMWVVGVHLTPQTQHQELLEELEQIVKGGGNSNSPVFPKDAEGMIVVGDLNVQYTRTFGDERVGDSRYVCAAEPRATKSHGLLEELEKRANAVGAFVAAPDGRPLKTGDAFFVSSCESVMLDNERFADLIASSDHPCPVRFTLQMTKTIDRKVYSVALASSTKQSFGEQQNEMMESLKRPENERQCVITEEGITRCPCNVSSAPNLSAFQLLLCPHHQVCCSPLRAAVTAVTTPPDAVVADDHLASVSNTDSASPPARGDSNETDAAKRPAYAASASPATMVRINRGLPKYHKVTSECQKRSTSEEITEEMALDQQYEPCGKCLKGRKRLVESE